MSNAARKIADPFFIGDTLTYETTATDKIEIIFNGTTVTTSVQDGKSILDVLLSNGMSPPHSCKTGICMACMAVIESGTVRQDERGSLSHEDMTNRKALACQAIPISKMLRIRFIG